MPRCGATQSRHDVFYHSAAHLSSWAIMVSCVIDWFASPLTRARLISTVIGYSRIVTSFSSSFSRDAFRRHYLRVLISRFFFFEKIVLFVYFIHPSFFNDMTCQKSKTLRKINKNRRRLQGRACNRRNVASCQRYQSKSYGATIANKVRGIRDQNACFTWRGENTFNPRFEPVWNAPLIAPCLCFLHHR